MPDQAEEDRRRAWDQRHASIDYGSVGIAGTCRSPASSTWPMPIDLDEALAADAQHQADLGSIETLDHRRATALGNIARRDLVSTTARTTSPR